LPTQFFFLGQEEKSQRKVYLVNLNWMNLILEPKEAKKKLGRQKRQKKPKVAQKREI
jgi:hypothetical protein